MLRIEACKGRKCVLNMSAGVGAMLIALAPQAFAQTAEGQQPADASETGEPKQKIEKVVVTAQKRSQELQKVPAAVTALTERDLTARGAGSVEQAITFVPGLNFSSNGTNSGAYSMRGVATSSSVVNAQSGVALYIDDINILDPSYPKVTTNLRLFDAARVEVLEGPQGTLFGSGSLGGAIRVITNKPDLEAFSVKSRSTLSTVEDGGVGYDLNGMINVPLVEGELAVRAVGYYQHDAGFIDNVARLEENANHGNSSGGRVLVNWAPTAAFNINATVLFQNDRPHDSAYTFYDNASYTWDGVLPNTNFNRTNIYSVNASYDMDWATLTTITTYADRNEAVLADFTPVAAALLGITDPSPIVDEGPSGTFSQEVRLTSPDAQRFRWLVGAVLIDNRRTVDEIVTVPGSHLILGGTSDVVSVANTHTRTREVAAFGEVSYDIVPELTATAGARVFQDELSTLQEIGGTAQVPSLTFDKSRETKVTPKFSLSYSPTDETMFYVQATEGYRIGQVNTAISDPISGDPVPAASDPDHLWNYEFGVKNLFLNGRLLLNAAVYRIEWSDIQLDQFTIPSGINYIANAGKAHINGAELEVQYRPTNEWRLGGSFSLLDTRLDEVNPTVIATPGDRLPASAPQSVTAYAEYTHEFSDGANVFARVDARYVGKQYADLVNETSLVYGRFTSVNLRGGVEWGNYTLTAYVDNLTDGDSKTSAFASFTVPVAIRQQPRTIGVTLAASW